MHFLHIRYTIFLAFILVICYESVMVTNLARRAMTTNGQKACLIIDHLVEALGGDASSSLRRAMILVDIDQYPGTSQTAIMERLGIDKSTVNREVDWLFNYGCIMIKDGQNDGRSKAITVCGYSKIALDQAMNYVSASHHNMMSFLKFMTRSLKQEKPTLRDAKIVSSIYESNGADKAVVVKDLYDGSASTKNRAVNKLIEDGVLTDA